MVDIVDILEDQSYVVERNIRLAAAEEIKRLRVKNATLFKTGDLWWVCTANDHGPFCRLCQRIAIV